VLARQAGECRGPRHLEQLAHQRPHLESQLERPARPVALPEGHLAGLSGGGRDEHPVVQDLLDPPRRGSQHEGLADVRFEHHLFVQLAHPRGSLRRAREEDAVQTPIGDRSGVGNRHPRRALPRGQPPGQAIPRHARPQFREVVRRVPARQHVEHALERRARQGRVGSGAAHRGEQLLHVPRLDGDGGDDLLRQHVERVARVARRLDLAPVHRPCHRRGGHQVAPVLREDDPLADRIHLVARAADALHAARNRRRRLDLDDEIHRAHVDAQLERRGGDQRRDAPGLQRVLDLDPLLPRERSVVGAGDRLPRQLVDRGRETLGEAAAVREDERRAVGADVLEQPRVDAGPDRRSRRPLRRGTARDLDRLRQPRQVLDGHFHLQRQLLRLPGVHDGDGTVGDLAPCRELVVEAGGDPLAVNLAALRGGGAARGTRPRPAPLGAAQEAGHLVQRPLGGRQPDALQPAIGKRLETLERERKVGATLGRHEGVDLVHDHGLDAGERLARAAGQHQVQRLRCGDQDVSRLADEAGPVGRRSVAGAHQRGRHTVRLAPGGGEVGDAGDRRPQVALDVHGKRLERRDVEHPAPPGRLGLGREHHPVDRPEERRQGLSAAGGGEDERRLAPRDGRPAERLRPRRFAEGGIEPVGDGRVEQGEGHEEILILVVLEVLEVQGVQKVLVQVVQKVLVQVVLEVRCWSLLAPSP